MKRPYHHWTIGEINLMRQHYPAGGVQACRRLWPHLSPNTIWKQASKYGIKFNGAAETA